MGSEASTSSIVPATPEALQRLILTLAEPEVEAVLSSKAKKQKKSSDKKLSSESGQTAFPWTVVGKLQSCYKLTFLWLMSDSKANYTSKLNNCKKHIEQLDLRCSTCLLSPDQSSSINNQLKTIPKDNTKKEKLLLVQSKHNGRRIPHRHAAHQSLSAET